MPEQRTMTVLHVDDYPAGRYATSRVLRQAGFAVLEAATGGEALDRAREQPDLIILDVNLPDLSGFEVAQRLKDDPDTAAIPILQMSAAYRDADHRAQGLEGGADAYLTQPVEPRELIATVRALLRVRQAETEVRESEVRFRSLVAAIADVVWTADPEGRVRGDLPEWRELTGQTPEEARGYGWLDALHPGDRERVLHAWEEAVGTGSTYDAEYRLRVRNGSFRYVSARGIPVREPDGSVREWVGVCVDVDERRRGEERQRFFAEASSVLASSLQYEETLTRVAALAVPALADGCMVHMRGEDGAIQRLTVAHTDPPGDELARDLLLRYLSGDGASGVSRVLRTGEPELVRDITDEALRRAARDEAHLQALRGLGLRSSLVVPLVARGETIGAVTFVTARSERTLNEADLAVAEELARRAALAIDNARLYSAALVASQAKSDFLATMSHELRTPMNAIMGYADLLDAEVAGPLTERQREQLGRITASSSHLLQLIDEILTFSRVEAGREEVRLERFELAELVRQTCLLVEPLAHAKQLAFPVELRDEPVWMESDPGKLRQILLNLLSNAVKFTDEGAVRLTARKRGDAVELEVRDTGIGITAEQAEKVFDPFWQVEQAPSRRVGGTGLGLSVTRHLARLLGGDVEVRSSLGEGSVFTVRLPLRAPAIPAGSAGTREQRDDPGTGPDSR
ncbi:MAG TPA: ATP-binding protein [Longimicrobiaceae bacterium]|nr:ATP-binding protein [Longimicrobiaceae bacterium]